jgi:hypothetical protein
MGISNLLGMSLDETELHTIRVGKLSLFKKKVHWEDKNTNGRIILFVSNAFSYGL